MNYGCWCLGGDWGSIVEIYLCMLIINFLDWLIVILGIIDSFCLFFGEYWVGMWYYLLLGYFVWSVCRFFDMYLWI